MNFKKDFPVRSQSRAKYVGWILFALAFATLGANQLMHGNEFAGVVMFFGGVGMAMRETSLRMKAKKWFKVHGCY